MFGGGAFKAAWNDATNAGKLVVTSIATGVTEVVGAAQAVGATAVHATEATAHATVEAAQWAEKQTILAARWAEEEAVAAAQASARLAKTAYDAAKKTFTNMVAGAILMGCVAGDALLAAENALVKGVFTGLARGLAGPHLKPLQDVLLGKQPAGLPHDGETVGSGCKAKGSDSGGTLPECPNGRVRTRGQVTYVNGIRTKYHTGEQDAVGQDGICKTMQKLANATCAEVIGVYNATGGLRTDIGECLTNIAKDSDTPSVKTLKKSVLSALSEDPPKEMTIYAHSQGGLITQQALAAVKDDLRIEYGEAGAVERMQHLSIKSFGTAEQGWPAGPNYEQFTNGSDPIPGIIAGAQRNYPDATLRDNASIPEAQRHRFNSPHFDPFASHSMDDVYIEKMKEIHGQPNCCD